MTLARACAQRVPQRRQTKTARRSEYDYCNSLQGFRPIESTVKVWSFKERENISLQSQPSLFQRLTFRSRLGKAAHAPLLCVFLPSSRQSNFRRQNCGGAGFKDCVGPRNERSANKPDTSRPRLTARSRANENQHGQFGPHYRKGRMYGHTSRIATTPWIVDF